MCSVNLLPIDISKDSFEVQVGIKFDPSKLNANLVKNADGLLAKMSVDNDIEWVVKEKKDYLITATKCRVNLGYNIWTFQLKFRLEYFLS